MAQWSYAGIPTFAHLPYHKCLIEPDLSFDVGIIGAPFDTAVSYRTGLHPISVPCNKLKALSQVIDANRVRVAAKQELGLDRELSALHQHASREPEATTTEPK